jgi:hypothetical protein
MFGFLEQVKDLWRVKSDNLSDLCKNAKELKGKFHSFELNHVLRVGVTLNIFPCHL